MTPTQRDDVQPNGLTAPEEATIRRFFEQPTIPCATYRVASGRPRRSPLWERLSHDLQAKEGS